MSRILRRHTSVKLGLLISFLLLSMSLPVGSARWLEMVRPTAKAATTFTVNSTGDGADSNPGDGVCNDGTGACTLRAAIQEANALAGDDAITFAVSLNGTAITLNTALPDINGNLSITGPGAKLLTVQRSTAGGTPNFRIVAINSGLTVTISGLTITNGVTASSFDGGGIFNGATLTLTDVAVNGNQTSATSGNGGWGGGISNGGTLTLNNCTVSNNKTAAGDAGGLGGGILNLGTMTLNNSVVSDNQTGISTFGSGSSGAGIFNQTGNLILNNSTVSGNQTGSANNGGLGGGIFNTGNVTLTNSHIQNNLAFGNGGAINNYGSLILITSTVSGNRTIDAVFGAFGGGIYNNITATVTLTNSTLSNNRTGNSTSGGAGGYGGGVYNLGTMTVTGSTISDNQTGVGIMVGGYGGGVFNTATLDLTNSTVSGNRTGNAGNPEGGGIQNTGTLTVTNGTITNNTALGAFADGGGLNNIGGTINLQNTIVAGNFRVNNTIADDISGMVDANSSFNLIGTGGSGGLANGINNNQVGVADPRLGLLANNGGPTLTHALLSGSVAIDAGSSILTTDQRGQPRPVDDPTVVNAAGGNASDIGAYEAHSLEVNSAADADDGLCRPLGTGNGCTLREAINAANAEFGAELVTFAPGLTSGGPAIITLSTALPDLSSDLTIAGSGANVLTVGRSTAGGAPNFRIFTVNSGRTVSISGLTITNGRTADGAPDGGFAPGYGGQGGNGGGIVNSGALTLTNVIVTGNRTGDGGTGSSGTGGFGGFGGGIYSSGTLTMSNVTVSNNITGNGAVGANGGEGGRGGGIFTSFSSGSLTLTNCTVSGNSTGRGADGTGASLIGGGGGYGGGFYIDGGTVTMMTVVVGNNTTGTADVNLGHSSSGGSGAGILINGAGNVTLVNSTISGNHTGDGPGPSGQGGSGGGILSVGTLRVLDSTISGNTTGVSTLTGGGVAGGVYTNGMATFENSTISGNTTTGPGGFGGGFYTAATLTLTDCTITGNRAFDNSNGNGIYANSNYPPPNIANTVVAGNGTAGASDLTGPFNSLGHNLIGNADGSTGFNPTDQTGSGLSPLNPRLGPLANNGGPTQTHALLAGSPALDAGDNATAAAADLTTDQRGAGFARIVDGPDADTTDTVDIGAFEAQVSVADIADQTINEDGSLSLPFNVGGAASITSVTATSSNTALVPNNPANISLSGSGSSRTLHISPVANASGTSTITVTVNGSNSQTMADTLLLTVNPVNDAPSFTKGPDQTVNENAGAQTINSWASNISAGPANEAGQSVSFMVTNNNNPALFAVVPAISSTGTLTYTPAAGVSGTAVITIVLKDNGGTANGGLDTSATQSFNITVREGGALQFSSSTFARAEDGGNAVITVTRTGGSAGEARIDYATSIGTATAGQDYTSASGTLVFADGVTTRPFNVAITNDAVDEPDETINLTLTNAAGSGSLGTPANAVLTINDNDPTPGISIDNTAVNEGNSGTATATFTVSLSGQSSQTVTVHYATANLTATAGSDYVAASGTLTFLPLETTKPINITVNGDINFEPNETLVVNLTTPVNATIAEGQGGAQITNDDAQGGFIAFNQSVYTVGESGGFTTITVNRTNDLSGAATVDYFTRDFTDAATLAPCNTLSDFASSRCDYTSAFGTLRFEPGETSKTFIVLISQDSFVETPESLSLTLTNPTGGAAFGNLLTATVTIADDATEPATNPIDSADAFVRQHYHDFLNREPDAAGLAFWSNQITECEQPGATCSAEIRRINVSAAFFLSIEFQETGYLVYRFYKSAYGNINGTPVPLRFVSEFLPDTQQIGKDVVVGQPGAEQQLEANKVAYALDFVSRSRFTSAYPNTLTAAQFVDALFANGGVTPSATDRDAAINEFGGAGNTADVAARARALRRVAENSTLRQQETNNAFVLMQYFGYLRRNPNDPPEANLDFGGYNFWLGKLNEFNGNFVNAEMVKAFIISGEYRQRFGP